MGILVDIKGQKFNRLTVLELDYIKGKRTYWKCQCDCGNIISVRGDSIRNGHAKSCGCLQKESARKTFTKHGAYKSRIYRIWYCMLRRCYAPTYYEYHNHGGRGIIMCDEWRNDFVAFYNWAMENGYKDNLTIDRIDNNGNYEPNNCRWATMMEQSNNTRRNVFYEYNGERLTIAQLARKYNIEYGTLYSRLKNYNMPIDIAINYNKGKK